MNAVNPSVAYVQYDGKSCGCECGYASQTTVFRSVWDRLCKQLFEATPPGIIPEDQLPDIDIWRTGIVLLDDSYPYTFAVATDGTEIPKQCDIIEYKGMFFIVGEVDKQE